MKLQVFAPQLWECNAPLAVMGMHLGHRMTVARLTDGGLWVHSPVEYTEGVRRELGTLGRVAHVVAPNVVHDTYLEGWRAAYPDARFHGARGFARARPDLRFTDTLGDTPDAAWEDVIAQHVIRGMPRLNEVAFLHRPSETLILTDLVFNLGPEMPFLSRVLLRLNGCYDTFGPSRLLKSVIRDRAAVRASIEHLLEWDFEAIIVSHGRNVPRAGKTRLREAFAFL